MLDSGQAGEAQEVGENLHAAECQNRLRVKLHADDRQAAVRKAIGSPSTVRAVISNSPGNVCSSTINE